MKKRAKNLVSMLIVCIIMTTFFTTIVYAAQYIYYRGGLVNATVEVENRLSYGVFHSSIAEWNDTNTAVNIIQVPGSGHSYVISGQWEDNWYGLYTPRNWNIFTGRAGKFKIEMNRNLLVYESDTFRKSVLVHELGHAFCLGDNPSSGNASIMNHNRNRNYLTWPTSNDIAGVNNVY